MPVPFPKTFGPQISLRAMATISQLPQHHDFGIALVYKLQRDKSERPDCCSPGCSTRRRNNSLDAYFFGRLKIHSIAKKRRMGRAGKLDVRIDGVELADSERATLRAVKESQGGSHTGIMAGGMVATSLIVWPVAPVFLLMHGK